MNSKVYIIKYSDCWQEGFEIVGLTKTKLKADEIIEQYRAETYNNSMNEHHIEFGCDIPSYTDFKIKEMEVQE